MLEAGEERVLWGASVDRRRPWLQAVGRGFVGQGCQQGSYTRLAVVEGPTVCQVPAEGLLSHGFMGPCSLLQPSSPQQSAGWGMLLRSLWD